MEAAGSHRAAAVGSTAAAVGSTAAVTGKNAQNAKEQLLKRPTAGSKSLPVVFYFHSSAMLRANALVRRLRKLL
jgi:poly(3-hydroxybutyrate) depolymerase